jgi:hypothetical protein
MNRLAVLLIWCALFIMGCDSDSHSHSSVQHFPPSPVGATTTRYVPEQYATIQAAVNAARPGDIVRVAAGTYAEHIVIRSKRFSLRGAGKGLTILHGAIRIDNSISISVEGFTITRGGVHARNSSIILAGNAISHNPGPGVWVERCPHVAVDDNDIAHNGREGVLIDASAGLVGASRITHNAADGVVVNNASVLLVGNQILSNGRDGVAIRGFEFSAAPHLIGNIIQDNGGVSNYDIICFGGNTNPTGAGNVYATCLNCGECRSLDQPETYHQ